MCQVECEWREIRICISENSRLDPSSRSSIPTDLDPSDDRFIAKELSRFEVQTMENFAPAYFDYMSSAVSANVW